MKSAQIYVLLIALVIALVSVVEASKKPSQMVRFNKKLSGKSTWFNGHDLKAVACYGDLEGNSHVNAGDNWMIGAVHMASYKGGEKSACFECARITAGKRTIVVRIIDDCAGCAPNQIDLTATAFKKLAPLDQGVVHTKYEFVRCPSKGNLKWPKSPKVKTH
ncbi:hypothetical protein BGX29_003832 [Mortierella sp. GBA35]|nr:hypothetical protein BGX23_000859 [Mortierella sp. AD031]KAF9107979.1 hypothetical protein BGX29_003832 [Mortierella sp. GBA35]KAG0218710.1 hypothetical protein BGX33_006273 [Mortierella sp. NVP41]